jgi:hypothetical protein
MLRLKIFAVLVVLMSAFMFVVQTRALLHRRHMEREGVEAEAVPIETNVQRGRRSSSYSMLIKFPVEDGKTHNARVSVTSEVLDLTRHASTVKIKYLRSDPDQVLLLDEEMGYAGYYLGGVLLLGGLFVCWPLFSRKSEPSTA